MPTDCIPYLDTPFFSKLIRDYLAQNSTIAPFYNRPPQLSKIVASMPERARKFSKDIRNDLCLALAQQYQGLEINEVLQKNLDCLSSSHSLTVTTGHQLNLFGGPLYFIYKIITVLKLAEQLNQNQNEHVVVPVFWMASEDHDFEEINFFRFEGEKISWNRDSGGAVGRLSTDGLKEVFEVLASLTGRSQNARQLQTLFEEAYIRHQSLADATRFLVHQLFGDKGLVVLDADSPLLKKYFINTVKKEITEETTFHQVEKTSAKLKEMGYHKQVNPRHINLFYLDNNHRLRIERDPQKGFLYIEGLEPTYSDEQLLEKAASQPDCFSPNALLRPVYQEIILPNLVYAGGAGELAYWLQLKSTFDAFNVPFPALLHRNSALVISEKQARKIEKMGLSLAELFTDKENLIQSLVRRISDIRIDFTPQKEHLEKQFTELYELAQKTDASFLGAVKAQEAKQKKGLDKLEKRLLKAQRKKLQDQTQRLGKLHDELFPGGQLQERFENFSTFYLHQGEEWFDKLLQTFDPFEMGFYLIKHT